MRAFYVELATYVNVSHAAQFGVVVSPLTWLLSLFTSIF
jgi:hypothetical protein